MKTALRYVLLVCGWLALALGVVGIFLPVLPTTPFVLVAAACFFHSSKKLHQRVISHPVLGPPTRNYLEGRGLTKRTKIVAITMLWLCILGSAYFCVDTLWLDLVLIGIATGVTIYLLSLPTARTPDPAPDPDTEIG